LLASEIVVPFAADAGALEFCAKECIGFIGEFVGPKVGNLDMSAILAELIDVIPLSIVLDLVIPEVGVAPVFGTLGGEFVTTGVGFVMTGIGFVMTGIGFVMTGVGFIMPPMPDIPDAIDSRFLPSSVCTESDAFRRVRRAVIPRRSGS
jgi:hypothetical protein